MLVDFSKSGALGVLIQFRNSNNFSAFKYISVCSWLEKVTNMNVVLDDTFQLANSKLKLEMQHILTYFSKFYSELVLV